MLRLNIDYAKRGEKAGKCSRHLSFQALRYEYAGACSALLAWHLACSHARLLKRCHRLTAETKGEPLLASLATLNQMNVSCNPLPVSRLSRSPEGALGKGNNHKGKFPLIPCRVELVSLTETLLLMPPLEDPCHRLKIVVTVVPSVDPHSKLLGHKLIKEWVEPFYRLTE